MDGHTDHTAAFSGDHAAIKSSISASEPPGYAPDGNPNDYEPIPGQGTGDSGFFVQRVSVKPRGRDKLI